QGHDAQEKQHDEDGRQGCGGPPGLARAQDADAEARGGSHDQQQAEQGQQVAPRRGKFVFEQLSQHLNTSRKRASTLLPSRSRSCAAGEASFTMPRSRNTTSSRMRSTSEMMCVEITIAASGGRQAVIVSSMK